MIHRHFTLACVALTLAAAPVLPAQVPAAAGGQPRDAVQLGRRHLIAVSVGFMAGWANSARVTAGGATVEAKSSVTGSLGYAYWFDDNWALQVEAGMIHSEVEVVADGSGASVQAATVVPLLIGVRYQPEALAIGSMARAYLSALVGPYHGSSARVLAFPTVVEAGSSQAFGARFGAGINVLPGSRLALGMAVQYHAVSDFDRPIGARENVSGLEVAFNIGVVLGGGR